MFSSGSGQPLLKQQVLGSPILGRDGHLYLFGFCHAAPPPAGCGRGRVFLARTVAGPTWWRNPFAYQYWTGRGWSPQAAAGSLIPAGRLLGISVGDFAADGHGLLLIEQISLAGSLQAWRGQFGGGPMAADLHRSGAVHRRHRGRAGRPCRALIGHPDTRSHLLISYYNPGNNHVDVAAYPW